jgi:hypothetical protein
MREAIDLSNLPTPIMRPASFDMLTDQDLDQDEFLPISDEEISRFLKDQTNLNADNDPARAENNSQGNSLTSHPQRVTPSETNPPFDKKRAGIDTTSSSVKPPDHKKTRGLECHVKNLSLIFEALSAS